MKSLFSSAAIDMFGDVRNTQDFVMVGAYDVRIATSADSRDARITAFAKTNYADNTKTVTVSSRSGQTLYRGTFDLF